MASGGVEEMHGLLAEKSDQISELQKEKFSGQTKVSSDDDTEEVDSDFTGFANDIAVKLNCHKKNISDLGIIFEDVAFFIAHQIDAVTPKEEFGSIQKLEEIVTNYRHQFNTKQSKRAIVFAGEVSSGKSSIINLLLGYDLLPTAHTYSTKLKCHLLDSNERKIIPYEKVDNQIVPSGPISATTNQELKTMVASCHNNQEYEYFEIFLPIPFLRKAPFFLVDTPGIGENDRVDTKLLEYLPEAAGFMFVVNAGNAGGVQKHGLRDIITALEKRSLIHPKCAAFICNKWDLVPEEEEEDVKVVINTKLSKAWPGYTSDQAILFSVKKPVKEQRQLMEKRLEEMIERDLALKCETHKRLLYDVLGQIIMAAEKYLELEELPLDTQDINVERLKELLGDISEELEMFNDEFKAHIETRSQKIAVQMHRCLCHKVAIWKNEFVRSSEFNTGTLPQLKQRTFELFNRKLQDLLSETLQDLETSSFCKKMRLKMEAIQRKLEHVDLILPAVSKRGIMRIFSLPVATPIALCSLAYGLWTLLGTAGFGGALAFAGVSAIALIRYKEWNSITVILGQPREQYVTEWMSELVEKTTIEELEIRARNQLHDTTYNRLNLNHNFWSSTQSTIKARLAALQVLSRKGIINLNRKFLQVTKEHACNLQEKVTCE